MQEQQIPLDQIAIDKNSLYREEQFTDLKVGSLRQLTPVNVDGTRDLGRPVLFLGQTQIMSQAGPLPINCEIEADSLEQACERFPDAIKQAVEAMMEEVKELQRREMSRIVVPGAEAQNKILGPR